MNKIKLYFEPHNALGDNNVPDSFDFQGEAIIVIEHGEGTITVALNENVSIRDHIKAVQIGLGPGIQVHRDRPEVPMVDIPLERGEVANMVPSGALVWNTIFRRPQPVVSIQEWCASEASDRYVYLPNDLKKQGNSAEPYAANAVYTEVLTNAYRRMCQKLGIKPRAALVDGTVVNCWEIHPRHGTQMLSSGSRAARLADSTLIDYDDSGYAADFIQAIMDLEVYHYEDEAVRRRVLSKVELMLMGRTSHTYNQKFIQKFLERVTGVTREIDTLLNILVSMVREGLVLEDSEGDFMSRALSSKVAGEIQGIMEVYRGCCNGRA